MYHELIVMCLVRLWSLFLKKMNFSAYCSSFLFFFFTKRDWKLSSFIRPINDPMWSILNPAKGDSR